MGSTRSPVRSSGGGYTLLATFGLLVAVLMIRPYGLYERRTGRALVAQRRPILLDEPSLGLSPKLVEEIFTIIARINLEQRVSMLLVEQNAALAFAVASYGYIMETGKIVIDGPVERLRRDQDVRWLS